MSEYNWKNIRADKEGRYAEMAEHPPDEKAVQSMKRKPYQNVDVLGFLQKKYKIGGDTDGADDKRETSSIPE
jgi:hypothetical protein